MFLLLVWWHLLVYCSSGSFSVDKLKKTAFSVLEDIRFLTNLGECFAPHLCFLLKQSAQGMILSKFELNRHKIWI